MGNNSRIEWTDATWNPIDGCTKVSEGCRNCYAERIAKRFWKGREFEDVQLHCDRLKNIDHLRKPRRIFVCSMGDLFHESIILGKIAAVWDEMICHPRHTFIVLTKRPARAHEFAEYYGNEMAADNIWLGVTAENQKAADERIPILLKIPAAVRFVSVEPMLEEIYLLKPFCTTCQNGEKDFSSMDGFQPCPDCDGNWGINNLDWVICGAESGQGARPFSEDWARNLKDQCVNAGVPFFYKQGRDANGKLVKMPVLDGRVWDEYP